MPTIIDNIMEKNRSKIKTTTISRGQEVAITLPITQMMYHVTKKQSRAVPPIRKVDGLERVSTRMFLHTASKRPVIRTDGSLITR